MQYGPTFHTLNICWLQLRKSYIGDRLCSKDIKPDYDVNLTILLFTLPVSKISEI